MSMRRLAVLAAVQSNQPNGTVSTGGNYQYHQPGHNMSSNGDGKSGRFDSDLNGNVNVLLGGAMLSGVIIVVVLVCYCCHKNMKKNRPREYSPYWRAEPDVQSLEVFTMDAHTLGHFLGAPQCDRTIINTEEIAAMSLPCPSTPGPPPPAYESLIFNSQNLPSPSDKKEEPFTTDNNIPTTILTEEQSDEKRDDEKEDEGLPSYEAALKLEANGYV